MTSEFTSQIASLCRQLLALLKDLWSQPGTATAVVSPTTALATLLQVTQKIQIFVQLSPISPNDTPLRKPLIDFAERLHSLANDINPDLDNVDALRKDILSTITALTNHSKLITLDTAPDPALTAENYEMIFLQTIRDFSSLITTKDQTWQNHTSQLLTVFNRTVPFLEEQIQTDCQLYFIRFLDLAATAMNEQGDSTIPRFERELMRFEEIFSNPVTRAFALSENWMSPDQSQDSECPEEMDKPTGSADDTDADDNKKKIVRKPSSGKKRKTTGVRNESGECSEKATEKNKKANKVRATQSDSQLDGNRERSVEREKSRRGGPSRSPPDLNNSTQRPIRYKSGDISTLKEINRSPRRNNDPSSSEMSEKGTKSPRKLKPSLRDQWNDELRRTGVDPAVVSPEVPKIKMAEPTALNTSSEIAIRRVATNPPSKSQSSVVNVLELVQAYFPDAWNGLTPTQQSQFQNELEVLLLHSRSVSALHMSKSVQDTSTFARQDSKMFAISESEMERSKGGATPQTGRSLKKMMTRSTANKKTLARRKEAFYYSLPGEHPAMQLAYLVCRQISNFITQVQVFLFSNNAQLHIQLTPHNPKKHEVDVSAASLYEMIPEIFSLLKQTLEIGTPMQSQVTLFNLVLGLMKDTSFSPVKKAENCITDPKIIFGFGGALVKRNLLLSLHCKTERLFYATSAMLSNLCSFEPGDDWGLAHHISLVQTVNGILTKIMSDIESYSEVIALANTDLSKYTPVFNEHSHRKKEIDWREKPTEEDRYNNGTLQALITRLTTGPANRELMDIFFTSFHQFVSPVQLWEAFVERYSVPKGLLSPEETKFIQVRTMNVVLQWLRRGFPTLDSSLAITIRSFAESALKESYADLSQIIASELQNEKRFQIPADEMTPVPEEIHVFDIGVSIAEKVLYSEEEAVAQQLTYIDWKIYSKIEQSELTGQKWSKPATRLLARNVIELIDRVERLSYWAATLILAPSKVKERGRALVKMIQLAKCLMEKRNFNSFLGIMNGLSIGPITRIHLTWDAVPHKIRDMYNELSKLQNPANSFKVLREEMKAKKATLPYLGTYLGDLTAMDENVNFVRGPDDTWLINMSKHTMITRAIVGLLGAQTAAASAFDAIQPEEPLCTLLQELPGLTKDELYAISLEKEPRGTTTENK